MVGRTDKLFGPIPVVILFQGYLFTFICGLVFHLLKIIMNDKIKEFQSATGVILFCIIIFQPYSPFIIHFFDE